MNTLLKEYAKLTIRSGAAVTKGSTLVINIPAKCYEFARLLVDEAYDAGAREVITNFSDDVIGHIAYQKCDKEVLKELPEYSLSKMHYYVERKAIMLSVSVPTPGLMSDIDSKLIREVSMANIDKTMFMREYQSSPDCQWCIVALPSKEWAVKVFPDFSEEEAYNKLLDAILKACHVKEDGSSVESWNAHVDSIRKHNKLLTDYNFKTLHYKNALGTDLHVDLVKDHIWCGGDEVSSEGVHFNPNIPTEETFTCPDKYGVNGVVYATKPLNYGGKLIKDFHLTFKDGKVVEYDAREGKDALESLITYDEGSCYLGEAALVDHDSPISKMGILFLNTLFDENASCHFALGRCYTINAKGALEYSREELEAHHMNYSNTHVDFMFGDGTMEVVGETYDGKMVTIMKNGNFEI